MSELILSQNTAMYEKATKDRTLVAITLSPKYLSRIQFASINKNPIFVSAVVICKKFYKNLNNKKAKNRKLRTVLFEI